MKKFLFVSVFVLCSLSSFSNSFYFGWDGFGVSSKFNYNLGYSYGAYYYRGVGNGLGLGAMEFYQQVNMNYNLQKNKTVGNEFRTNVQYRFFSPMFVFQLDPKGQTQVYCTAGIGELQSNSEAFHNKWSRTEWGGQSAFDSSVDISTDLKSYVFRFGFGLTQFLKLGGNFHLFVQEDAGFLAGPMVDLNQPRYAAVRSSVGSFFQPTYISIRVGIGLITHSKGKKAPWRLHPGKDED